MSILEVENVSIRYITGDFKDIGLKEFVMRRLKGDYQIGRASCRERVCLYV